MQVQEIINEIKQEIKQRVIEMCFGEDAVNIVRSSMPWNCFVERKDGRVDFITGGYWNYISTLCKVFKTLMKELEKEVVYLERIENKIKEEWEEVV